MGRLARLPFGPFRGMALLSSLAVLALSPGLRAETSSVAGSALQDSAAVAQLRIPGLPIPVPPVGLPDAVPSLQDLIDGEDPLTTSLGDVAMEMPILDGRAPTGFSPLTDLPWDAHLGYLAMPGAYQFVAESYCLKAGTHGPGGGDGYAYADLAGSRGAMVQTILREAVNHPEIPQSHIQLLLWGVIARTQLQAMPAEAQAVAQRMLTEAERRQINGGALGLIPREAQQPLFRALPQSVRQVLEAEAELRRLLTQGNATYQQIEAIAVLTGSVGQGDGSRHIPQGRWSLHPDGYFIRYQPFGYSRTQVQAWVPEALAIERDSQGRIVALTSHDGYRVETDYNDQVGALRIPGEPHLRAYQFRQIRLIRPNQPAITVDNQGWTFVGRPTGQAQSSQMALAGPKTQDRAGADWLADADRLTELYERYQKAKEAKENVDAILEEIDRLTHPPTREQAEEVLDRDHYQEGLDAALDNNPEAKAEWIGEHLKRVERGFLYAICQLRALGSSGSCGDDPPPSPPDDRPRPPQVNPQPWMPPSPQPRPIRPGGQGLIPGNTNRQRLGLSDRPVY